MCGGSGTRLDRGEKPLFEIGDVPMVERVLSALEASRIDTVYAVSSPKTPKTTRHLAGRVEIVETDGEGYVEDLADALEAVEQPVLSVVADLPLLAATNVNRTIEAHDDGSLTVCVPAAVKRCLGVSVDSTQSRVGTELAPTGLNVVDGESETSRVSYDVRLAVNVNRPADATVATALSTETADGP